MRGRHVRGVISWGRHDLFLATLRSPVHDSSHPAGLGKETEVEKERNIEHSKPRVRNEFYSCDRNARQLLGLVHTTMDQALDLEETTAPLGATVTTSSKVNDQYIIL